jgi:uncharacterized protein (DUF2252 family)
MIKSKRSTKKEEKHFGRPPIDAAYLNKPAHLQTRQDRYEFGRALRVKCPREDHSEYAVNGKHRADPIDLLIESNKGRIETLLPIRYGRMLVSPFSFYRGSSIIMAADLADTASVDYAVQACGDCHLMNFGAFATPERNVIFDINDFDETFPAPWEWDLKRLAASFAIASRNNGHVRSDGIAAAIELTEAYRNRMHDLAEMKTLDAWYSYIDYEALIQTTTDPQLKKRRKKVLAKALSRDSQAEFVKLAHVIGKQPKIKDQPPLIYHENNSHSAKYKERLLRSIESYRESLPVDRRVLLDRYELVDSAIKVVGIGSVGTVCGIMLFFAAENDPLFLQVKEARQSVLQPYSHFKLSGSNGERVVNGQKIMQAASDMFLGYYVDQDGKHFYVRQLRDVKIKPLVEIYNPENMLGFARNCGWALAMAHARSGDPCVISGYIGKGKVFSKAIGQFADSYMQQNESDHKALIEAIRSGTIDAATE